MYLYSFSRIVLQHAPDDRSQSVQLLDDATSLGVPDVAGRDHISRQPTDLFCHEVRSLICSLSHDFTKKTFIFIYFSEAQFFYSGLLPVVLAFILIYFWVVNFVYYRDLKLSTQKTLPNIVKSADEATASRTSGCLEPPSGTSMTYMDPSSTNLENPYM